MKTADGATTVLQAVVSKLIEGDADAFAVVADCANVRYAHLWALG